MSTYTKEFTKERLIEKLQHRISVASGFPESEKAQIDLELARIALASLEAEPVAWLLSGGGAKNHVSFDSGNAYADPLREVTPLYTDPPAPVALPSGYSDFEEIWSSSTHPLTQDDEMKDFAWDIWNACRAAMLQSFGNSEQLNSPVIPDGWKLVPIDPTKDMLRAGQSVVGFWLNTVHCYSKMLAAAPAAPQQEAENRIQIGKSEAKEEWDMGARLTKHRFKP